MTPQSATARHSFFLPCPRGMEAHLAEELDQISRQYGRTLKVHQQVPGGVHCSGELQDAWRMNLHSRLASRVLLRLAHHGYTNENDIYDAVLAQPWDSWFSVQHTIRVDVTAIKAPVRSLEYITLKIKDGVCDHFRDLYNERPSVDTASPDIRINAFLEGNQFSLYLDTSGDALFKRGWRHNTGAAPLRENLAAGLLACAGWKPGMWLFDPMCGSGTILVEAAQIATGIPAGWNRDFAFQRLHGFDEAAWEACREAVPLIDLDAAEEFLAKISGSDISGDMVVATRENLTTAGIPDELIPGIALKQIDAQEIKAPYSPPAAASETGSADSAERAILLTNPPYGERIGVRGDAELHTDELLQSFFNAFSSTLKQRFAGWEVFLFTADRSVPKLMRLKESRKTPLFNGALECRLFRFDMVAGFNRKKKEEPSAG